MDILVLFLVSTIGALISSLTGLGGGSLVLAGLLLIYPPTLAIPLHSFTQLAANGLRVGIFFKKINWKVVGIYSLLMFPGAWIGGKLFNYFNPNWLKILVGSFILFSILPLPIHSKEEPKLSTFAGLGAISGFLGVFVGAVGPLVTPFFNRLKLERQSNISTKSAGQMMLQISKIVAFWGATGIDFISLKDNVLILVLGSLVGVAISIPISKKISDEKFEMAVNVLLGLIALKVIYEGARELF